MATAEEIAARQAAAQQEVQRLTAEQQENEANIAATQSALASYSPSHPNYQEYSKRLAYYQSMQSSYPSMIEDAQLRAMQPEQLASAIQARETGLATDPKATIGLSTVRSENYYATQQYVETTKRYAAAYQYLTGETYAVKPTESYATANYAVEEAPKPPRNLVEEGRATGVFQVDLWGKGGVETYSPKTDVYTTSDFKGVTTARGVNEQGQFTSEVTAPTSQPEAVSMAITQAQLGTPLPIDEKRALSLGASGLPMFDVTTTERSPEELSALQSRYETGLAYFNAPTTKTATQTLSFGAGGYSEPSYTEAIMTPVPQSPLTGVFGYKQPQTTYQAKKPLTYQQLAEKTQGLGQNISEGYLIGISGDISYLSKYVPSEVTVQPFPFLPLKVPVKQTMQATSSLLTEDIRQREEAQYNIEFGQKVITEELTRKYNAQQLEQTSPINLLLSKQAEQEKQSALQRQADYTKQLQQKVNSGQLSYEEASAQSTSFTEQLNKELTQKSELSQQQATSQIESINANINNDLQKEYSQRINQLQEEQKQNTFTAPHFIGSFVRGAATVPLLPITTTLDVAADFITRAGKTIDYSKDFTTPNYIKRVEAFTGITQQINILNPEGGLIGTQMKESMVQDPIGTAGTFLGAAAVMGAISAGETSFTRATGRVAMGKELTIGKVRTTIGAESEAMTVLEVSPETFVTKSKVESGYAFEVGGKTIELKYSGVKEIVDVAREQGTEFIGDISATETTITREGNLIVKKPTAKVTTYIEQGFGKEGTTGYEATFKTESYRIPKSNEPISVKLGSVDAFSIETMKEFGQPIRTQQGIETGTTTTYFDRQNIYQQQEFTQFQKGTPPPEFEYNIVQERLIDITGKEGEFAKQYGYKVELPVSPAEQLSQFKKTRFNIEETAAISQKAGAIEFNFGKTELGGAAEYSRSYIKGTGQIIGDIVIDPKNFERTSVTHELIHAKGGGEFQAYFKTGEYTFKDYSYDIPFGKKFAKESFSGNELIKIAEYSTEGYLGAEDVLSTSKELGLFKPTGKIEYKIDSYKIGKGNYILKQPDLLKAGFTKGYTFEATLPEYPASRIKGQTQLYKPYDVGFVQLTETQPISGVTRVPKQTFKLKQDIFTAQKPNTATLYITPEGYKTPTGYGVKSFKSPLQFEESFLLESQQPTMVTRQAGKFVSLRVVEPTGKPTRQPITTSMMQSVFKEAERLSTETKKGKYKAPPSTPQDKALVVAQKSRQDFIKQYQSRYSKLQQQSFKEVTTPKGMTTVLKQQPKDISGLRTSVSKGASGSFEKFTESLAEEQRKKAVTEYYKPKTEYKAPMRTFGLPSIKTLDRSISQPKSILTPRTEGISRTELTPKNIVMPRTETKTRTEGISRTELTPKNIVMPRTEISPRSIQVPRTEITPKTIQIPRIDIPPPTVSTPPPSVSPPPPIPRIPFFFPSGSGLAGGAAKQTYGRKARSQYTPTLIAQTLGIKFKKGKSLKGLSRQTFTGLEIRPSLR